MAESFHIVTADSSKPFTIGRKSDNSLCIHDMLVSRSHAIINFIDGKWILKNLTQNSVTEINDIPVNEEEIHDGDVIHIGPHQLRARVKEESLSLLVLHLNDIPEQEPLSAEWKNLTFGESEDSFPACSKSIRAKIDGEDCKLALPYYVFDENGKKKKNLSLKNGEHVKFPWNDVYFRDGILYSQKNPVGYNVHIKNLDIYAGKKQLLGDINFDLNSGEILAIIGRSGQGKSSLLRLIAGLYKASKNAEVRICGLSHRQKEIRQRIAFLEQEPELRKDLTVKETLWNGASVSMNKRDFLETAKGRLEKFMELFELSDLEQSRISTLSGGEIRRIALAQELMGTPGLILLDEPLSGLDPYNAKILCNLLKQLAFLGHTIILTTHSYEALKIANKVLILHKGRQGFFGTPQNAYQYFKTDDAEKILCNLDDETEIRWKNSEPKLANAEPAIFAHYYFPKSSRQSAFCHYSKIAAKQLFRDKGKLIAFLVQPIAIGFLLSQIFSRQTSLWIISFAIILCANWYALSLSIREIVKEKKILLNEFRKGTGIIQTTLSKFCIPLILSFIQTVITYAFCAVKISLQASPTAVALVFLCTLAPAISIGLLVSALSKNSGQANAFLPILIIPQVALAGALVPLDQMQAFAKALSSVIWSRYNQESLTHLFLEQADSLQNKIFAISIAVVFYIVTVLILKQAKKAK